MAQVSIPLKKFISGELPSVCAVSGVIAKENYMVVARSPKGPVRGALPLTGATVAYIKTSQRTSRMLMFTSIAVMAVGVATQSAIAGWISLATLATSAGFLVLLNRRSIRARVISEDEVRLTNVHQDFVNAIAAPPSKCNGCPGTDECTVTEMYECDGYTKTGNC